MPPDLGPDVIAQTQTAARDGGVESGCTERNDMRPAKRKKSAAPLRRRSAAIRQARVQPPHSGPAEETGATSLETSAPIAPQTIGRMARAVLGRATLGIFPAAVLSAYFDWLMHLAISPGKQTELVEKTWRKAVRLGVYAAAHAGDARLARSRRTVPCRDENLVPDRREAQRHRAVRDDEVEDVGPIAMGRLLGRLRLQRSSGDGMAARARRAKNKEIVAIPSEAEAELHCLIARGCPRTPS